MAGQSQTLVRERERDRKRGQRTLAGGRAERGEAVDGGIGEAGGGAAEVLEDAAVQIGQPFLQLLDLPPQRGRLRLRLVARGCGGDRGLALAVVRRVSGLAWRVRTASHGEFAGSAARGAEASGEESQGGELEEDTAHAPTKGAERIRDGNGYEILLADTKPDGRG